MHQRKPWNRAFSSTALKEYEVIVANRARQLLGCIEDRVNGSDKKAGVELDIAAWFGYFAYACSFSWPVLRSNILCYSTDFMGDMA